MTDNSDLFALLYKGDSGSHKTGPTGYAGQLSPSARAFRELLSKISLDQWLDECSKPDTTKMFIAYTCSAIQKTCEQLREKGGVVEGNEKPNFQRLARFFVEHQYRKDTISAVRGCSGTFLQLSEFVINALRESANVPTFASHLLLALSSIEPLPTISADVFRTLESAVSTDETSLKLLKSLPVSS